MNSPQTPKTLEQHCWERRERALYRVRVSILYHLKRARFFDQADKLLTVATAVSATAAVGVVLKQVPELDVAVSVATAVLAVIQLVTGLSGMARNHSQAAAEFRRLQAEFEAAGERWTEEQCNAFAARILELEASEPAPLSALVADCQNQLAIAVGGPTVKLTPVQRWFKHWVDFDASTLVPR